jgi:pimeloyl-ACP methyl ester carboxylesterase/predicted glycosyltransferase
MRAREPDRQGHTEHDGIRIAYEVFGQGEPTVLLIHGWQLAHSRMWKAQVAYLARHYRVVTYDLPGNGRSDRSADPAAYRLGSLLGYATSVLDATDTASAVLVSVSSGACTALPLAAAAPDRVEGMLLIGPGLPVCEPLPPYLARWRESIPGSAGWDKVNRRSMAEDLAGFAEFFHSKCFVEPHSSKQIEDAVGWTLETAVGPLVAHQDGIGAGTPIEKAGPAIESLAARVTCPVLLVHGTMDEVIPPEWSERLAELLRGDLVLFEGSGHLPCSRDPVRFNLIAREFIDRVHPPAPRRTRWTRARARARRALFVSSPIGLGHAQRDVAIADELRRLHPDLEIDWLAQHPVTQVLESRKERIHPASRLLASESKHIESESSEHELHCFQALRRMDETLVANFHVFDDVAGEGNYDLWVADEAWDVDYFLHENPERKRAAYCWLTDFVGYLPMPSGGDTEAALAADYNAEMIEQVERFRRVRDRAIFVGNPDDIVPLGFGSGLPLIREWTQKHFDFAGYVTGFDPAALTNRDALRAALGYRQDEQVCIVTVGGTGVGESLLRKIIAAYPAARARVPALRMVVVAGPRIDPASLPAEEGLAVRGYVPELYRHLAACDLALVQGGLTTTMELTAHQRPFVYFPLAEHFEQQFHVPHRLSRYGAGERMSCSEETPETIAAAIATHIGRPVRYRPVEAGGAERAARLISEML